MNLLVGAGAGEAGEALWLLVTKCFDIFLLGVLAACCALILLILVDVQAILIPRSARRLLFGPLVEWLPIYGSERLLRGSNGRVKSKNLVTECLIGKGSSGIFYETTWLGCSQGSPGRLARKDFPGVQGEIFESEVIPLFELPDHPNLLKTLCWTVDTRSCSLVTEYMRDDLSSVVRRKKEELRKKQAKQPGITGPASSAPFELHEALEIAIQIATGMEYLHLIGITHGDLKANNIFIDWKEDKVFVKLADFGLLQTKRRSTMVSQRAFCFQMMGWSAPELVEDYLCSTSENLNYLWTKSPMGLETSTSTISTKEKYTEVSMMQADSYSFALICAFVLGGQLWNAKLSPSELQREISNSGLRPTLPSECPKTLRSLICLCWDANPKNRPPFSYIRERLQEEQQNLQEGDGSVAAPLPPPPVPIRSPDPDISSPSPQASQPPSLGAPNLPAPSGVPPQGLNSEPPTITKKGGKKNDSGISLGAVVVVILFVGLFIGAAGPSVMAKNLSHLKRSPPPSIQLIKDTQGPSHGFPLRYKLVVGEDTPGPSHGLSPRYKVVVEVEAFVIAYILICLIVFLELIRRRRLVLGL